MKLSDEEYRQLEEASFARGFDNRGIHRLTGTDRDPDGFDWMGSYKNRLTIEQRNYLADLFRNRFLTADEVFKENFPGILFVPADYFSEKQDFIHQWFEENLGSNVDDEQSRAISEVKNHVQVIARAGSGKTSTIVNRSYFLQKHCGVAHSNFEGIVRIVNLANFSPTAIEIEKFKKGILTPVILRLAGKALADNKSVVLLTRRKELFLPEGGSISIDEYLSKFRKLIPEKWQNRITISTAHSFKGREGDVVIILDAFSCNYPLIHPNWIFARILGESIQQVDNENRRLFYVALTRAKETLFIITETEKTSPYLEDISKHIKIPEINWSKYPPVIGATDYVVVRISGSFYELTDEFKADGYQFRRSHGKPVREKLYQRTGFSILMLHSTPWAQKAGEATECRFEVSVLDGSDKIVELYFVDLSGWRKLPVPVVDYKDNACLLKNFRK